MAQFEGYERREAKILDVLKEYGISSIDECKDICDKKGVDAYTIVQETQPICFENAKWAYTVGAAIAIKEAERTGDKSAARRCCKHRYRSAELLHPRLRCGEPQGRSGTRQPRQDAPLRGDRVLLLPRGPRVLRGCRGRDQDRAEREQGAQASPCALF